VANIAAGKLSAAADYVERAMARTIPVILGFLSRLIGLGDVSGAIKNVISAIQEKVDKAIDAVIAWIVGKAKALFGKTKAAASRAVEWWKQRKPFKTKEGEDHEIFYSGDESNPIPMVASKEAKPIEKKVDEFDKQASGPHASETEKKGKSLIERIRAILKKDPSDPNLVINMQQVLETYEGGAGKETTITRKTGGLGGSKVGLEMTIDWLGPGHPEGTPPESGAQKTLMDLLITDPKQVSEDKYVRGHLLNHNLGGKGNDENMFPITGNANKEHLGSIESKVKGWVNGEPKKKPKHWVWYEVKVKDVSSKLDAGPKSWENYVNCTLACRAVLKDAAGDKKDGIASDIPSKFELKQKAQVAEA
jgi:hypothetical protein